jgi:hypothetical protein
MDERTAINVGTLALIAALLVVSYLIRWHRLRETKRRMEECLARYFNGDLPLDELSLLTALADVKTEFGLPDRFRSEGWRAGRE